MAAPRREDRAEVERSREAVRDRRGHVVGHLVRVAGDERRCAEQRAVGHDGATTERDGKARLCATRHDRRARAPAGRREHRREEGPSRRGQIIGLRRHEEHRNRVTSGPRARGDRRRKPSRRRQRPNRSARVRSRAVHCRAQRPRAECIRPAHRVRSLTARRREADHRAGRVGRVAGRPPSAQPLGHLDRGGVAISARDPQHRRTCERLRLAHRRVGNPRRAPEHDEVVHGRRLQRRPSRGRKRAVAGREEHGHLPEARPPAGRERVGARASVGEDHGAPEQPARGRAVTELDDRLGVPRHPRARIGDVAVGTADRAVRDGLRAERLRDASGGVEAVDARDTEHLCVARAQEVGLDGPRHGTGAADDDCGACGRAPAFRHVLSGDPGADRQRGRALTAGRCHDDRSDGHVDAGEPTDRVEERVGGGHTLEQRTGAPVGRIRERRRGECVSEVVARDDDHRLRARPRAPPTARGGKAGRATTRAVARRVREPALASERERRGEVRLEAIGTEKAQRVCNSLDPRARPRTGRPATLLQGVGAIVGARPARARGERTDQKRDRDE